MGQNNDHGKHHIVPLKVFWNVFFCLIAFTILTVYTAKFVDLGPFNAVLAFAIATAKALLVMAFFMHLKYDERVFKWIIGSAFFFVLLLFLFCVLDLATRVTQSSTL
mgnify:CR=1 FL=1